MKRICRPFKNIASALSILLLLVSSLHTFAQEIEPHFKPGELDFSFGIGGKVTDSFMTVTELAIQKDGKLVIGGFGSFELARLKSDGTLDKTFGVEGKAVNLVDSLFCIAIQPDGKILVAGSLSAQTGNDFSLARYNANGTPDKSFGTNGLTKTDFFGMNDRASAIAVQKDGNILIAGFATVAQSKTDFALARYTSNGLPDFGFGIGGKVTANGLGTPNDSENFDVIEDLAIQEDGRIVAVGTSNNNATFLRFQTNGVPDATFGIGGKKFHDLSVTAGKSVVIQPDGRIVMGGGFTTGFGLDYLIMRLLPDGTLDPDFAQGGSRITDFNGKTDSSRDIVLLDDGRILQVGTANTNSVIANAFRDFAMVCYTPEGELDPNFGEGGKVVTDFFNNFDQAEAVAIQPGGRVIVAGQVIAGQHGFGLAAYALNGEDFSINLDSDQVAVKRGKKVSIPVNIFRVGGLIGKINITVGAISNFKIKPAKSISTSADSVKFTFKAKVTAPTGPQTITFTAKDNSGRERTRTLTLVVQ